MKSLRVALAQIAPALGAPERNLDLHLEWVERAAREGAELVAFPELSLTGYLLRDQVPDVALARNSAPLRRLATASTHTDILAGFVEESPDHRFYNAAAYFSSGRLVHLHRKLYLPTYGMLDEGRDFAPGERLRCFDAPHGRSGVLICEDLWHTTSAWLLVQDGMDTLFTLSSGPTRGSRPGHGIGAVAVWRGLLEATARFQTVFVVYVNRVGCEDGLTYAGGSMVVDPLGRVVGELPALAEELLVVELDGSALRRARLSYPMLRDSRLELVRRELDRIRLGRYGKSERTETKLQEISGVARPSSRRGERTDS